MISRLKDSWKIILFLVVFYIPPTFLFFSYVRKEAVKGEVDRKVQSLKEVFSLAETLQFVGDESQICTQLQSEARAGRVIVYAYKSLQTQCSVPANLGVESYPNAESDVLQKWKTADFEINFLKTSLSEDSSLVLGFETAKEHNLWYYMMNSKKLISSMIIDLVLVFWIFAGFLFLAVVRNIDRIKKIYSNQGKSNFWLTKLENIFGWLNFSDLKDLETTTKEVKSVIDELTDVRKFEERSLEYSMLKEIRDRSDSGEIVSLPYSFQGVVVRVDINGYSQLMRTLPLPVVKEVNTRFKQLAAELAYRYRGFFEGSAGDEVVYVFTGDFYVENSVCFVRDLMSEFGDYEFSNQGEKFKLFVKSSLYQSEMMMDLGVSQIEFDGLALLYTNRMFSELVYKDKNVLIIDPKDKQTISLFLGSSQESCEVVAKGMKLSVQYVFNFNLDIALNSSETKNRAKYFKSDFEFIRQLENLTLSNANQTFDYFKSIERVQKVSTAVRDIWIKTIRRTLEQSNSSEDSHVLASLLRLGSILVNSDHWNDECTEIFRYVGQSYKGRSLGNALETLIELNQLALVQEMNSDSSDLRTKANYLLAMALLMRDEASLGNLLKMAKAANAAEAISGLYALATYVGAIKAEKDLAVFAQKNYILGLEELQKALKGRLNLSERVKLKIQQSVS